jgi:hypothetical protein
LGPIITFHTYSGQSKRHAHYDDSSQDRDPKDLNTFNDIIGGRDAIEKSKKLIDFFAAKTRWEDGVAAFLAEEVFALDKKATHSNAEVDERFGLPDTSGEQSLTIGPDASYEQSQYGFERKLALLEDGLACGQPMPAESRAHSLGQLKSRFRGSFMTALRYTVITVGLLLVLVMGQILGRAITWRV